MWNGKMVPFLGKESVNVGSHPANVIFGFGAGTNGGKIAV